MAIDRRWLWGGIAVGGAATVIYMYKKNKAAEAKVQQNANQAAGYAYGYGYGYGMEPLTYEPYGYGYGPYGFGSYGYGGFTPAPGGLTGVGVSTPVPQTATTNAEWSAAALSQLTNQGYSGTSVLAALGQYLLGLNLTADQAGIVTAAIAIEGYPPVPGAGGFPPAMKTGGTPGGGQPAPKTAGDISNLAISNITRTSFVASWNKAANATGGYRYVVTQLNGKQVKAANTSGTRVTVSGLHPGWSYNFGIQALPGGHGANHHVTLHP